MPYDDRSVTLERADPARARSRDSFPSSIRASVRNPVMFVVWSAAS